MDAGKKVALITGASGQDGSYLTELLAEKGYEVLGTTHRPDMRRTARLAGRETPLVHLDLTDSRQIRVLIERVQPDEVYNLAARSSSAQLFDDPVATAEINGVAVVRLLDAIRHACPKARFCQASSSEVFGKATQVPQDETTPLRPRNAYGAAKVFAQNMVEAYRERFGLFACSAILFNHESPRRGPEYVTRKVSRAAARIASGQSEALTLGDLESRRDWGYAGDYVRAMWLMLQQAEAADYVIATGESHTVRELCDVAFARVGLDFRAHIGLEPGLSRGAESVELRGDYSKAARCLGWRPSVTFSELVKMMVDADCRLLKDGDASQQFQREDDVSQD